MNHSQIVSWAIEAGYLELNSSLNGVDIAFLQRFAARVLMTEEALQRIERKRHAAWMEEAADEIQHWGEQAGERTQQRYGLKSTVDDFRGRAAALRARVEG